MKPQEQRELKYINHQVLWTASYLKGDAYARFKSYLVKKLAKKAFNLCNPAVAKVFISMDKYMELLAQTYENLNETRIAEL